MRLKATHPAVIEGRTIATKKVFDPAEYKGKILKPASDNKKLGNGQGIITKGKWAGMPMFSLTLEERATCPRSCHHWDSCYGNNSGFAHRMRNTPELTGLVDSELQALAKKYRTGFVVRLHILGDFYSTEYVNFWIEALRRYPNLHVFGYTARTGDIKYEIARMNLLYRDRSFIRYSQKEYTGQMQAVNVSHPETVTCPQQTGKTESCLTCGICWGTTKSVHFITH